MPIESIGVRKLDVEVVLHGQFHVSMPIESIGVRKLELVDQDAAVLGPGFHADRINRRSQAGCRGCPSWSISRFHADRINQRSQGTACDYAAQAALSHACERSRENRCLKRPD
jgi:hypothetical protein